MKIRLSMEGKSLSVDVGYKANYLFMKFASQLIGNSIGDEEIGKIAEKLSVHKEPVRPHVEEQEEPVETHYIDENTSVHQLMYRGFIYWKCEKCGSVRGFCMKKESKGVHCMDCDYDSLFEKPLKPMYVSCECGQTSRYMTNMEDEMFDVECFKCGAPVPIKWNEHKKVYETIRN